MSQEQQPEAQQTPASSPDELVQDLRRRLTDKDADTVKRGMTNTAATTGQKVAEKADQYTRS